ncbi:MAG: hypothetical protein ACLQVD_03720 [Capsulimonadaceae bacterium]
MNGEIKGARITRIVDAASYISWLLDNGPRPESADRYRFAIVQCTDTLAWGLRTANGRWTWGHEHDKGRTRRPSPETLIEARCFGPEAEALLWRGTGGMSGRVLEDEPVEDAEHEPLERTASFVPENSHDPDDKGARVDAIPGSPFVLRTTGSGRRGITPRGVRLRLREYVSEDPTTGKLRIAATRFVEVE